MTDTTVTAELGTPNSNYCIAYVTGAIAAQNDTLIVSNFRKIFGVSGSIEPASGNTVPADPDIDDTTKNKIICTGTDVGTAHLIIVGIPA